MIHSYLIKADTLIRFYQVINLAAAFNGIGCVVNGNTGNETGAIGGFCYGHLGQETSITYSNHSKGLGSESKR